MNKTNFPIVLAAFAIGIAVGYLMNGFMSKGSAEDCILDALAKSETGYATLISRACQKKYPEDLSKWNNPFN